MFLIDTNVISELRKGPRADRGVVQLLSSREREIFLPVLVIGELRQGSENLRHRGDFEQARILEQWLEKVLQVFRRRILDFDAPCAHIWGKLMGPSDQNPIDKQISAIGLNYDLTVVTRNTAHFSETGVRVLNPFRTDGGSTSAS